MSEHGESSKKADKRGKKQQLAAVMAALQRRRNGGIRISGGGSNSPTNILPNRSEDENESNIDMAKKKTRGKSKMSHFGKGKGVPLPVDFNERGQPIGDNAAKFASCLGTTARELVPVTLDNWKKLSNDFTLQIWEHIQQKFIVDECHKKYAFRKMGKMWGDFRSYLIRQVMKQGLIVGLPRATTLLKPDNVQSMEEWQSFIRKRNTPEYKARCQRFKKMRASQTIIHTTSRKGFAHLEDEMRRESATPDAVSRVHVWIRGYQRKNGGYKNDKVKEIVEKVQGHCGEDASSQKSSLNDDGVAKVLGPERRGRVRGLGFGANPSKVDGQKYNRDKVNKLENELKDLNTKYSDLAALVEGILNNTTQCGNTSAQSSSNVVMTQTKKQKKTTCAQNSPPKNLQAGSKCKLLHWVTGKVVAISEIASTDPYVLVYHVPLGHECWKVWVHEVLNNEVTLYRPTREFFLLSEALSSTIAWPIKYIKLD